MRIESLWGWIRLRVLILAGTRLWASRTVLLMENLGSGYLPRRVVEKKVGLVRA
jgi:hypothetical protein